MENALVTRDAAAVSVWREYADETAASGFAGDLLLFRKGKWTRGEDKSPVPDGAIFVANMPELWRGWQRWFVGECKETLIHRVTDRVPLPTREELGHTDKTVWETDGAGVPKDPWSRTDRLILREADSDEEVLLTFVTGSKGGRDALGKLSSAYGRGMLRHPGQLPVVKLGGTSYEHPTYGETHKPKFLVVGWRFWDDDAEAEQQDLESAPLSHRLDDAIPF